jgi:hypothetical protein
MFGLPIDFDSGFLAGKTLDMVCFTAHQVNLHFSGDYLISVEGEISLSSGESLRLPDVLSSLYPLIDQAIKSTSSTREGTLSISFKRGTTLHIFDSSKQFESYSITKKGIVLVRV